MERGLFIVILLVGLIAWLGHRRQMGLPLLPRRGEPLFGKAGPEEFSSDEMDRMAATLDRIEERLDVVERIVRLSDPMTSVGGAHPLHPPAPSAVPADHGVPIDLQSPPRRVPTRERERP